MKCKEAEKLISLFLDDELENDDLREFMDHIQKCEECKEELTIQFLVLEGVARLETGNVFDLQKELKIRMDGAEHDLRSRENMQWVLYAVEGLVGVALLTLILLLIFL